MADLLLDPYVISGTAGVIFALLVIVFLSLKKPYLRTHLFLCGIFGLVFMFLGAHVLFFLVGLPEFGAKYGASIYDVQSFITAFLNAASGMVFYGGLFGAIAGILLYCRMFHLNSRTYLNPACCAFPMLHAFGRIGCALGGCCYGIEYHGFLSMQYTSSHIKPGISDHIADFSRFPVQYLEAALELAICFLLIHIYLKTEERYSITAIYLFSYGIVRFFDEFLRGDTIRGIWGPLSTSQWIALGCIIGVIIYALRERRCLRQSV